MKRNIYASLLEWKKSPYRKPLIMSGARQVGKTYVLKEFAAGEYRHSVYFNFEMDPRLGDFFRGRLDPAQIIEKLSIYTESRIVAEDSLVIFDEIQECPEALNSLKYFQELAPSFHVAAAGSLLGTTLGKATHFPVGKVSFLNLLPMSFNEFLEGIGRAGLRGLLERKDDFTPLEAGFHEDLLGLLKTYYFVGGMPEAVVRYAETGELGKVRLVQAEILGAYDRDLAKHTTKAEAVKNSRVWSALPAQLGRENKKFRFAAVAGQARARDYMDSVQWLVNAGLAHKCHAVTAPKLPLAGYREENAFKLYMLDVGLLGARLDLSEKTVIEGNRLFQEYNGAFVENYAAQELLAAGNKELHYWTSPGRAEVDFVMASGEAILPLEVKSGTSREKRSLRVYGERFKPPALSRAGARNFKRDGDFCNYPLYAVSLFPSLTARSSASG
jgi:predicted AAA+ superfamily ATPase